MINRSSTFVGLQKLKNLRTTHLKHFELPQQNTLTARCTYPCDRDMRYIDGIHGLDPKMSYPDVIHEGDTQMLHIDVIR